MLTIITVCCLAVLGVQAETLQQVHVIFRHGHRTPDVISLYPKDPLWNESLYYPEGFSALTMRGKRQVLNLGKTLRRTYNSFLGNIYTPKILEARCTVVPRTHTSLQLVLAGLFKPNPSQKVDNLLNWQPIPYTYEPSAKDTLLGFPLVTAGNKYLGLYGAAMASDEVQSFLDDNKKSIEYIKENSGLSKVGLVQLYTLYFGLFAEETTNHTLPGWTNAIYPELLWNASVLFYKTLNYDKNMQKYTGGKFIRKVLEDTNLLMNGTAERPKIYLYSCHEYNIANVLKALNAFKPQVPPSASYIVFEFHKIDNQFGFKVFYQDYSTPKPQVLNLEGCDEFCPLKDFMEVVKDILPDDLNK